MKVLLDTNVLIMLVQGGTRLPRSIAVLLADHDTQMFVSVVSLWEIAIKYRLKKLTLPRGPDAIAEGLAAIRIAPLSLHRKYAVADADLPPTVKDPFDRMIVAIAEIEGWTLLTTDTALLDHPLAWRP